MMHGNTNRYWKKGNFKVIFSQNKAKIIGVMSAYTLVFGL
jgi:hypothetical protein